MADAPVIEASAAADEGGGAPAGNQGGGPAPGGTPPNSSSTPVAPVAPAAGQPVLQPPTGSAATLAGGASADPAPSAPATWPEDWRAKLAGEDKAFLKTLDRYTDPAALAKAHRELQAKVSAGLKPQAPPDGATPEQMAAWRKDAGLPESPDAYISGLALPNGVVFGEADQPVLKEFAQTAHDSAIPPAQFAALVSKYAAIQDQQAQERRTADAQAKNQTLIALTQEWGGETKGNLNAIPSLFAEAPDGLIDKVLTARMGDGSILGNSPEALRWLATLAREMNPMAALLPAGAQGDALKGGEARIKEIEGYMGSADSQEKYWRKPEVQEELRNLYEAREKMASRSPGAR